MCNIYHFNKKSFIAFKGYLLLLCLQVNHFPGSGFITMKASLAVSEIDFIPTAFKMPADKTKLLEYVSIALCIG